MAEEEQEFFLPPPLVRGSLICSRLGTWGCLAWRLSDRSVYAGLSPCT